MTTFLFQGDKEKELIEVYVKTKLKFFTMKNQVRILKKKLSEKIVRNFNF